MEDSDTELSPLRVFIPLEDDNNGKENKVLLYDSSTAVTEGTKRWTFFLCKNNYSNLIVPSSRSANASNQS